jgi:hypothetical protein
MAHLYKRGRQFWLSYYLSGKLVQKSLKTKNERLAQSKKKRLLDQDVTWKLECFSALKKGEFSKAPDILLLAKIGSC